MASLYLQARHVDDLRENTECSGYSVASPVIQWFWEVVQDLSKEDKARLLQFVTGTSKIPELDFEIQSEARCGSLSTVEGILMRAADDLQALQEERKVLYSSFNQLDLPEYPSKQHLEDRLLLAIHEASEGFGFG